MSFLLIADKDLNLLGLQCGSDLVCKTHNDPSMSRMGKVNLDMSPQAMSFLHLSWLMVNWRTRQAQPVCLLEELKSVDHGRPGAEQTEAEGAEEEEETQEASEGRVLQSLHTSGQLKINCERELTSPMALEQSGTLTFWSVQQKKMSCETVS